MKYDSALAKLNRMLDDFGTVDVEEVKKDIRSLTKQISEGLNALAAIVAAENKNEDNADDSLYYARKEAIVLLRRFRNELHRYCVKHSELEGGDEK